MDKELKKLIEESKAYLIITINNNIGGATSLNMKKGWGMQEALDMIRQLDKTSERLWQVMEEHMEENITLKNVS